MTVIFRRRSDDGAPRQFFPAKPAAARCLAVSSARGLRGRRRTTRLERTHPRGMLWRGQRRRCRMAQLRFHQDGRKFRPMINIQFTDHQDDGGVGYRQQCADQIADAVVHCAFRTDMCRSQKGSDGAPFRFA
jgi:hypothetical protein